MHTACVWFLQILLGERAVTSNERHVQEALISALSFYTCHNARGLIPAAQISPWLCYHLSLGSAVTAAQNGQS